MLLKASYRDHALKRFVGLFGGLVGVTAVGALLSIPALSQRETSLVNPVSPVISSSASNLLTQLPTERSTSTQSNSSPEPGSFTSRSEFSTNSSTGGATSSGGS